MKYNGLATLNHSISKSYPSCLADLNEVILREDDSLSSIPALFDSICVQDMDCVERIIANAELRQRRKSMDISFAISNTSRTEMLLVELRFNYKNLANLNREVLMDKVFGTSENLGITIPIHNDYIFIFQPSLVAQAINRLQRMNPRIPNNYVAMDIHNFKHIYFTI